MRIDMQQFWTEKDFDALDKRQRAQFFNSLSGAKSANLVGTVDGQGQTNLSMVSSCVHLGANPSLMAMIIRPRAVARHTIENLIEMNHWTINHVTAPMVHQAHQTSARYPKEVSEFDAVGLTAEFKNNFVAPFVKESPLQIGLKLVRVVPIIENDTEMVIGEIKQVYFEGAALRQDGSLSINKLGTVAVTGLDHYQSLNHLVRLSYAKPSESLEELTDI
jgi:flavin reductase (DIM6/NTAB) family NADH-FMN oxidoreductase RutF